MQLLTVSACLYRIHHDIFRCHKGQLAAQSFLNNLRVHNQSVYHVQAQIQDSVDCQKSFRDRQSLIGGIIQCSLKPLGSGGNRRIQRINHHITGKGSNSLAPHGISLICHGRGTNLALFKGLLHFL